MTTTTFKTIFSGHLEFGNSRTYEQVVQMFEHRSEAYYRSDIAFKIDEIFDESTLAISIPRLITQSTEKSWRNTINLLEYISQFAVAGDLSAWVAESGKVLKHSHIEPDSDKVAVQSYLKGRQLIKESGKETEAKAALSRAIEKFERHALAYERRGHVNFLLKNYEDAMYDFSKCIDINPRNEDAYLGRAFVHIFNKNFEQAIPDLGHTIKQSIPLQPIYWKARRVKAECHIKLEQWADAVKELKFYTRKQFQEENPNWKWHKKAYYDYGIALIGTKAYKEAIEAFNEALEAPEGSGTVQASDIYLQRGIALKEGGKDGFVKDWKTAADKGSKKAVELLAEVS
ncbi:MAG: tetratricopeptide repeat protein [Bacteroidota bacterium]